MYWYVLFVKTGKEEKIEEFLKKQLDMNESVPFIPMQEILFKKSGMVKKEVKPLFPGYVFVESCLLDRDFLKMISSVIKRMNDRVAILKYSDTVIAMKEAEKQMLLGLCDEDHCVEASYGIIEGDRIHIVEGPLKGKESIVKKVNRHKRQAYVEVELMGDVRLVSIALEILEKHESHETINSHEK